MGRHWDRKNVTVRPTSYCVRRSPRAVNVGGTGRLPMAELKAMCVAAGYSRVQTHLASGNVDFASEDTPSKIKAALEAHLKIYAGKPVGVVVRTAKELATVLAANPFPNAAPNRTCGDARGATPPLRRGSHPFFAKRGTYGPAVGKAIHRSPHSRM